MQKERFYSLPLILALLAGAAFAQAPNRPETHESKKSGGAITPQASPPIVNGAGTIGRIPKWTVFSGYNYTLGDSVMTESNGNIGIGTSLPTSKLTVAGLIESLTSGIKFPDGTIQTTSATGAFFSIPHDATLKGNGNTASPLGVAIPLSLSGNVFGHILTVQNDESTGAGAGVQISAGPGAVALSVFTGTSSNSGGWGIDARGGHVSNVGFTGGIGVRALGGSSPSFGGPAVHAEGGSGTANKGGAGVRALGGSSTAPGGTPGAGVDAEGGIGKDGGAGVKATGGVGNNNQGGPGVEAEGGNGNIGKGGDGLRSIGGTSLHSIGGLGVFARGGQSDDETGGHAISARGGDSDTEIGGNGINATGGSGPMGNGLAGKFDGDVEITGNLNVTGATKNFKIDHPLDPENKYLYHAAIESAEALNVYSGNVTTDAKGRAVVTLPEWFDAVNRDLRYQLTAIGTFAQAIVAEKVRNNRFTIRTNSPNVEVSWQVTGVRSDPAMRQLPFNAEENKPERERGYYLHPELYGKPEQRGIGWAGNPELMQQGKEARERIKQKQE